MSLRGKSLRATFLHAPECRAVEVLENALVAIGEDGRIAAVWRAGEPGRNAAEAEADKAGNLVEFGVDDFIIPGLVDLHVHAPQYPQLGLALDVPLEVWLQKYTFPLEARYEDLALAAESYGALVADLLRNGTTTAVYFATIHQEASRLLADICLKNGQRALVGKVAMDCPTSCPDYYRDASAEEAVEGTLDLIEYIRNHKDNSEARVLPVVTPRFIPSCTDEALSGLGRLAREHNCHVQTHCSESDWEHNYVLGRHGVTDTESLDRFGLLGRRTILAHATRLTEDDMGRIVSTGSGVAHCPLSNVYFGDAIFPLRWVLEKGMHVGLGTDISGGPTTSIFESARMAIAVSRLRETLVDTEHDQRIDLATAFHLATAGGGVALDLPIGCFQVGYHFDALRIDTAATEGSIRRFGSEDPRDILQKIVYTATRPNIANVWVGGLTV